MGEIKRSTTGGLLVAVLFLAAPLWHCEAANILGFFPTPSKSHLLIHCAIANALVEAGHNVTVVTAWPDIQQDSKYHHIEINFAMSYAQFAKEMVNKPKPVYQMLPTMLQELTKLSNDSLSDPGMKRFLHDYKDSFDLLILGYFLNDMHIGLANHFNCPVVLAFTVQPVFSVNAIVGNPYEAAYVPTFMSSLHQPMGFKQRLYNFVGNSLEVNVFQCLLNYISEKVYNYHFPSDRYPSFEEAKKNISLVLTNHHFSQGPIRPNVPAIIEIGGIQIKEKPDPLPVDIAALLNNAKNGAIYFSFGTNVQGSILSKEKAKIMFDVLSKLPYMVLWKWGDTNFPGTAPNIIYKSWLPQDDILAHPNVKLFITHGGQGSVAESQYHGVPMVGIPLFVDQPANIAKVVHSGFGVRLDYLKLTHEDFERAILEVIGNPKYAEAVKRFSAIYRDRPMSPRQTAVYWIEYVLRHKGAKHLQSPALQMNTFQLLSLDVIGFLALVLAVIVGTFVKLCKLLCCRRKKARKPAGQTSNTKKNK